MRAPTKASVPSITVLTETMDGGSDGSGPAGLGGGETGFAEAREASDLECTEAAEDERSDECWRGRVSLMETKLSSFSGPGDGGGDGGTEVAEVLEVSGFPASSKVVLNFSQN